ncbi:MAG: 2-amino-4-hydroxy-6-hydroxymethyldihydropteridine diphosphokinase [Gammaproteobacteria bacterium]|nr:2-amino-4-hydroxy-6-hydroxymethyldihydropteridine diphosphokinase [Gammaproteobacteria bacterium]
MRYWLALGSNDQPESSLDFACVELAKLGEVFCSSRYEFPPRSGVGVDYINMAVRLDSELTVDEVRKTIYQLEDAAGRIRKSSVIRLDIDVIAWEIVGQSAIFDIHRLPLPMDVIVPMKEIWTGFEQVVSIIQP